MTLEPSAEPLRKILTTEEVIELMNSNGFNFELETFENVNGYDVLCLYDNTEDGPTWHVFLGTEKDLYEGFDLVCFLPTIENPYRCANDWNEDHYKSIMTVMTDNDSNSMYVHPYFALRLCSTVDFSQLLTVERFQGHLDDWLADVDLAYELYPYEPEKFVGNADQDSEN